MKKDSYKLLEDELLALAIGEEMVLKYIGRYGIIAEGLRGTPGMPCFRSESGRDYWGDGKRHTVITRIDPLDRVADYRPGVPPSFIVAGLQSQIRTRRLDLFAADLMSGELSAVINGDLVRLRILKRTFADDYILEVI